MSRGIVDASRLHWGVWKYIITDQGVARFTQVETGIHHVDMVPEGATAVHAGFLTYVRNGKWLLQSSGSESLGLYPPTDDAKRALTIALGTPPVDDPFLLQQKQ